MGPAEPDGLVWPSSKPAVAPIDCVIPTSAPIAARMTPPRLPPPETNTYDGDAYTEMPCVAPIAFRNPTETPMGA